MASDASIGGVTAAKAGEEKLVCIALPRKVHTVPVVSFRLRVALYFPHKNGECNKAKCQKIPDQTSQKKTAFGI